MLNSCFKILFTYRKIVIVLKKKDLKDITLLTLTQSDSKKTIARFLM